MSKLFIQLFGYPEVYLDGQKLVFPTRKTLALLIYLVVENSPQSRDKLAALLWPVNGQEQSRATVRTTLARLRATLRQNEPGAASFLITAGETVSFDFKAGLIEGDWLAWEGKFADQSENSPESLQALFDLYRGEFLEGALVSETPEFEEWAGLQREKWHQRALALGEKLTQAYSNQGDFARALETARRWVVLDPLSEIAHYNLIALLLATNNYPAAQRAYENCRGIFQRELGFEPPARIRKLLANNSQLPWPLPKKLNKPTTDQEFVVHNLGMVGRQAEFSRLVAAFSNTQTTNRPGVIVVEGEAGIGKTRLATEFTSWATLQGALVLRGRAFENGGRIPYQSLLGALRPVLEAENAPDDLLSDIWLAELGRLLPELLERYPDLPSPFNNGEAEARTRLFEAVARLGEAFARRAPLLLIYLDDIQWADADTLDLLHYATQRWSEIKIPLILLITVRTEALQAGEEISNWLNNLARITPLTHLKLGPLSSTAITQLLTQLSADKSPALENLATWLSSETGGQPFFLLETLKVMQERQLLKVTFDAGKSWQIDPEKLDELDAAKLSSLLPPSVRETIRARYSKLSTTSFSLLAAGAVIGRTFSFEQLSQVAGLNENEALSALDEVLRHNLLREAGAEFSDSGEASTYFFTHDKIRDVIYTEAGDARRRVFHRRTLEFLQRQKQPSPALLAHHSLAAGLNELSLKYYLAAGEASLRLFAVREAISNFLQGQKIIAKSPAVLEGLAETDLQKWFVDFGRAYELIGDFEGARAVYQNLLEYAQKEAKPDLTCLALYRMANVYFLDGLKLDPAEALLTEAEQLAETSGNKLALAEIAWNKAQTHRFRLEQRAGLEQARKALQLALELAETELVGRCLNSLAYLEASYGMLEEAARHALEAAQIYLEMNNKALEADNLSILAEALIKLGKVNDGVEICRVAYDINTQIDSIWGKRVCLNTLSMALVQQGKYAEALEICEQGLALNRINYMPMHQIFTLTIRGNIFRLLALLPEAITDHQQAFSINDQMPGKTFASMLNETLGYDYAVQGEWEKAAEFVRQGYNPEKHGTFLWLERNFPLHIKILVAAGEMAQAHRELVDYQRITGSTTFYRLQVKEARAYLFVAENKSEAATGLLEEVAQQFQILDMSGESWRLYQTLTGLYARLDNPAKMQETTYKAISIIDKLMASLPYQYRRGLQAVKNKGFFE